MRIDQEIDLDLEISSDVDGVLHLDVFLWDSGRGRTGYDDRSRDQRRTTWWHGDVNRYRARSADVDIDIDIDSDWKNFTLSEHMLTCPAGHAISTPSVDI
ncbi:hypothetical protein ACFSOZ_33290 [Mesorhizobium newzealandense]|uniref:PLAT domain-containing protein n=1 Tax=Mesorhizobium newzealandense TaxID=1300302 RepID=A0ABW4UM78_9HYPH